MDVIKVEGGNVLRGSVQVEGAKNSALKLMAATVMAPGVYHLTRIPDISDVRLMCKVLETLGAFVMHGNHELTIDTTGVDKWVTPYEIVSKMRASISVLGPLIVRFGKAVIAIRPYLWDGAGHLVQVRFAAASGRAAESRGGYAGYSETLDEDGFRAVRTYLNTEGKATDTAEGYSEIRYVYDGMRKLSAREYYDVNGILVKTE